MAKILIIDDEKMIANVVGRVLAKEHSVDVLHSGIDALERLQKPHTHYDLLLIDLLMPEVSGSDVLDWVHANLPQTKIIMMTAYGDPNAKADLIRRGASIVLSKPFEDVLKLPQTIAAVLG